MLLSSFEQVGLLRAPSELEGLQIDQRLPAGAGGVAVADGLSLLRAVMDPGAAVGVVQRLRLGAEASEIHRDEQGQLDQVTGLSPSGVRALTGDETRVIVGGRFELDPILFGRLRDEAQRDPRVVTALGQDPSLGVRAGWLFNGDRSAVSVSLLDVRVGDVSFPLTGTDRPPWVDAVLRAVAGRLGRLAVDEPEAMLAERLATASLSPDPGLRHRFARVCEALAHAPFGLGAMGVWRADDEIGLAFGDELIRARQLGPAAVRAARVVTAAWLDQPDVLVVEEPVPDAVHAWLVDRTRGEDATLEQVLLVTPPAGLE